MLTKNRIPLLIASIICLEVLIYFWAVWTASFHKGNFFSIEPEFIFDKCARNSGRVSAALNLIILIMVGRIGLKQIYLEDTRKDAFRILLSLFAINHLIHFFCVFQTFKHHAMALNMSDNKHGITTFICILILPFILWGFKNLNKALYFCIIVHLFNVSYFIMETFYNKIKPDKPAYHNQFGIFVTCLALVYILYRMFREIKQSIQRD